MVNAWTYNNKIEEQYNTTMKELYFNLGDYHTRFTLIKVADKKYYQFQQNLNDCSVLNKKMKN